MQYTLKKSLGQHFLQDENTCHKIVQALQTHKFENLLEVGPGAGALTKHLVSLPNINFKAVEIDTEKITYLTQQFPDLKNKIIHTDILQIAPPFDIEFAVIGNFPYNISSQILFKILKWNIQVPIVIGMFQKEVAERIVAKSGNKVYGILSVLVQYFYEAELLFEVAPNSFYPPPKVMSAVIQLKRRQNKFPISSEEALFSLVKTAFQQRRKMLRNAVKSLFDKTILADKLFNLRAENLSVADFSQLTFSMNQHL